MLFDQKLPGPIFSTSVTRMTKKTFSAAVSKKRIKDIFVGTDVTVVATLTSTVTFKELFTRQITLQEF
jgi:hypothetical protein